mmetsp:Transcript_104295/g.185402  ORF Transcript_104295/g.185402 Transcript_104295/m.185402 type:complete len:1331 (+) Transcript_104295:57-4049(+)
MGASCFSGIAPAAGKESESRCWTLKDLTSSSSTSQATAKQSQRILTEPWVNPLAKTARSIQTLAVGARIHFASKRLKRELDKHELDDDEVQERWEPVHRSNAQLVLQHIFRYRGFYSKIGQSLSAKKASLPAPWVETLQPLQNEMPYSRFAAVRRIIQKELGQEPEQIFINFEQDPVASASVAQAHIASLRKTGEKVCVKVQHPGVADLMNVDLSTLEFLLWLMKRWHSDAPDLTEIAKEWRRTAGEEVDFRLEAKNASDAFHALRRHELPIKSCEPIMEYCSRRVLTMRYVAGWKINDIDKFPAGADRETIGSQLWEGFAVLVFDEGLIHGDPHPGNVFVEIGDGADLRPVFLDWGIVKRLTDAERLALAKWVVACLSMDRVLFMSASRELGYDFTEEPDYKQMDQFMQGALMMLRDTIPSSSMRQFIHQRNELEGLERDRAKVDAKKTGAKANPIGKIPGNILYFFRGMQLLHDCCSMLDVMVPVARVMLKYARRLLERTPPPLVGSGMSRSNLEGAVLAKLKELDAKGDFLAAQVAVARGSDQWLCDVSFGRAAVTSGPVSDGMLMPLLDAGTGVLVKCLLFVLSRPTVTGKVVGLDSEVSQLWPEFSQQGKAGITIRQLLQHQAGLHKPFSSKLRYRSFCNEHKVEETLAAAPFESAPAHSGDSCCVLGVLIAALLRRATGHDSAAEALKAILKTMGLEEDIVYSAADERMAHVGHRLLEEVSMASMWELLEERQRRVSTKRKPPPWLTLQEFAQEQPWCVDPLLVNREDLRKGSACTTGRGLRATARALCRFYMSDIPEKLLKESCELQRKLNVECLEEWEDLGKCLDVGLGWQLLKFRKLDGTGTIVGYGHTDGATGSVALRLPDVSVAVLLSCVDRDARQAAADLLEVVAAELGLQPLWRQEVPQVQEQLPAVGQDPKADSLEQLAAAVQRVELQLSRLGVPPGLPGLSSRAMASLNRQAEAAGISGSWVSAEMDGLDQILDAFNVPSMARGLARKARRTLRIEERGDAVRIAGTMSLAGRKMEEKQLSFKVGENFQGELPMAGSFRGFAKWLPGAPHGLLLEKRFTVKGCDVLLEETYAVTNGRLLHRMCIAGRDVHVPAGAPELELLCRSLDPSSFKLKTDIKVSDSVSLLRGGKLISPQVTSLSELSSMPLPGSLKFHYDEVACKIMFDLEGGQRQSQSQSSFNSQQLNSSVFSSALSNGASSSDVHASDVHLEGYAWKESRHLKQWRRRRLVLRSQELKCFKEDGSLTEIIPLSELRRVESADEKKRRDGCVGLFLRKRTYYFSFGSLDEKQRWMQELRPWQNASMISHQSSIASSWAS